MSTYQLKAQPRKLFGRQVKSLRRQGLVPGNVFGPDIKSLSVQFDQKTLLDIVRKAGETSLVTLSVEGESKTHPVLIAGVHTDPVSGSILHVDLHEVNLKEKTTASVPVKTTGTAPAVAAGNILVVLHNEIEVEALPTDLPDAIEVDVSGLAEVNNSIAAKDLKVDRSKVTLQIEDEELIVTIQEPAKEEAPAPVEESAEGESKTEEAKPGEGEAPKEGDKDSKPADSPAKSD